MSPTVRRKKEEFEMFGPYWMNGWSLLLGLTAWGLGLAASLERRSTGPSRWCSMGSLTACVLSLCLEVFNFARLADMGDVSAFLDTANAARLAAGALVAGTLALNGLALAHRWRREAASVRQ